MDVDGQDSDEGVELSPISGKYLNNMSDKRAVLFVVYSKNRLFIRLCLDYVAMPPFQIIRTTLAKSAKTAALPFWKQKPYTS